MTQSDSVLQSPEFLRVSDADVRVGLDVLAQQEAQGRSDDRRDYQRYLFRLPVPVAIMLPQPGGSVAPVRVYPYDISTSGLGFLHSTPVQQGTRCCVRLPTVDGDIQVIPGTAAHSRCLQGRVHFVGVHFDEPINARDFVELCSKYDDDAQKLELAAKIAKELGDIILANPTLSALLAKYDELGQALVDVSHLPQFDQRPKTSPAR